jgi:hypothetical protein
MSLFNKTIEELNQEQAKQLKIVDPDADARRAARRTQQMIKTIEIHEWMKGLRDDQKKLFAINWKMPHTIFNTAYHVYPRFKKQELQGVDWNVIFKSRDMGCWSHGGTVYVQSFIALS